MSKSFNYFLRTQKSIKLRQFLAQEYSTLQSRRQIRDNKSFKSYRPQRLSTDWSQSELENLTAKKEKRVLMAVVQNDMAAIRELDSPRFYRITDNHGLSLLHIAILQNNKEVFDYLIALPNFPLEMVSDYGETPLITAILVTDIDRHGNPVPGSDYFAFKLIENGADLFFCDKFGYTIVACTALKHHVKMAEVLIQNGVDLNRQEHFGNTPLHQALEHEGPKCVELVSLLLQHGADPRIANQDGYTPFEKAVLHRTSSQLQEILFYYTYDKYFGFKTHLSVLIRLAHAQSDLLTQFDDVFMDDGATNIQLFYIDEEFLKVCLEKFPTVLRVTLRNCSMIEWWRNSVTFEKVELFVQSDLRDDLIVCIQNMEDHCLFLSLIDSGVDESTMTRIFCYLLSYGLQITTDCVQCVYKKYGYCELLKILLHMDICLRNEYEKEVMPNLLFDMSLDLNTYLKNPDKYSRRNVSHLLRHFANSKLSEICCGSSRSLEAQVPLLVELARNVFRKYLIDEFKVETSKRFYTLINNLNVNNTYKKIITFETALYGRRLLQ